MRFRISWSWWFSVAVTFLVVGGGVWFGLFKEKGDVKGTLFLEDGSFVGYITSVRTAGTQQFFSIDAVEFLSGDEAFAAIKNDFGCDAERAAECVPSMNNDFYIRNHTQELREYPLLTTVSIEYQPNAGSPELKKAASFLEFLNVYKNTDTFMWQLPFRFTVASGSITRVVQQYVP